MINIDYLELKLYDKNLPLNNVPYRVIRISPEGQRLHLVIDENAQTMKTIAFFNSIIESNQDKLKAKEEVLPSPQLLEVAKLGQEGQISLEPIFKGHTNTLLATPMKRIDGLTHPVC